MKEVSTLLTLLLVLYGCSENESGVKNKLTEEPSKIVGYKSQTIPDDSLKFYAYQTKEHMKPSKKENFEKLNEIPSHWIELSNNQGFGFFIYKKHSEPGNTRIKDNKIRFGGYLETVIWPIYSYKKGNDETYYFNYEDSLDIQHAKYKIEILDQDTMYAIEEIEVYAKNSEGQLQLMLKNKNLCIPAFNEHLFNHIDEPNKKSPDSWIKTHEVDLEEFKKRKNRAQ